MCPHDPPNHRPHLCPRFFRDYSAFVIQMKVVLLEEQLLFDVAGLSTI
jgi:hypothetical protein